MAQRSTFTTGTQKQIDFAHRIRREIFARIDSELTRCEGWTEYPEMVARRDEVAAFLEKKTDVAWWIEKAQNLETRLVMKVVEG